MMSIIGISRIPIIAFCVACTTIFDGDAFLILPALVRRSDMGTTKIRHDPHYGKGVVVSSLWNNAPSNTAATASRSSGGAPFDFEQFLVAHLVAPAVVFFSCCMLSPPAATAATVATAAIVTPPVVVVTVAVDPTVFTNDFIDPLHPLCRRRIEVNPDGNTFRYFGSSVAGADSGSSIRRGCSAKEIKEFGGLQKESFHGDIVFATTGKNHKMSLVVAAGNNKGGLQQGVWEPARTTTTTEENVDGIRWNNGNKWRVKEKSTGLKIGEGIAYAYLGLSTLAGVYGVTNGIAQKKQEEEE